MTFAIGGSARVRKRLKEAPAMWECECASFDGAARWTHLHPGSLVRCLGCGMKRPGVREHRFGAA